MRVLMSMVLLAPWSIVPSPSIMVRMVAPCIAMTRAPVFAVAADRSMVALSVAVRFSSAARSVVILCGSTSLKDLTPIWSWLLRMDGMAPMVTRLTCVVMVWVLSRLFMSSAMEASTPKPPEASWTQLPIRKRSCRLLARVSRAVLLPVASFFRMCTMPMKQEPKVAPERRERVLEVEELDAGSEEFGWAEELGVSEVGGVPEFEWAEVEGVPEVGLTEDGWMRELGVADDGAAAVWVWAEDGGVPEVGLAEDVGVPEEVVDLLGSRSEEHTSELQSQSNLVCRLLLEKKKKKTNKNTISKQKNKINEMTN